MEAGPEAMVTPGAVRDRMVVWICWLLLKRTSFSMLQAGMVQPEGSPPAALRAGFFFFRFQRISLFYLSGSFAWK